MRLLFLAGGNKKYMKIFPEILRASDQCLPEFLLSASHYYRNQYRCLNKDPLHNFHHKLESHEFIDHF